jgi:hypothetical protein
MTHALSANEVVFAWEHGQGRHAVDKALLLLSLAQPTLSVEELSSLTIGQRNIVLLKLRAMTLGKRAECFVTCPQCEEKLEFSLNLDTFLLSVPTEQAPADLIHTLNQDGYCIQFRLPTNRDLATVVALDDLVSGRVYLLEQCIVQAQLHEQTIPVSDLPEPLRTAIAEAMAEADPLAEILITVSCFACELRWKSDFDIVAFFWKELEAQARRLLYDVHTIASAYGWSESDILVLSAPRRQFYLEQIR